MDENYLIGVDVEVFGKDRFRELLPLMKEVAQQTTITDAVFQRWLNTIQKSTAAGFTFADAMNRASKVTGSTKAEIESFTSSLRAQITEYDRVTRAAEESARRQEAAAERAAQRVAAIAERARIKAIQDEGAFGNRASQVFGRIGGRAIGGITGAPGGGFIGSQTVQALGVSSSAAIGIGGAGVGILAGYELAKIVTDTAKYAQEQANLSRQLGISVQETQILTGVTKLAGVEFASVQGALQKLNRVSGENTVEARKVKTAFEELGLSAGVSLLKPDEQLRIILESLRNVQGDTEKERLAVNLLGNEGRSLLPLVGHFDSLRQAVTASGAVIDRDGINKMEEYRVNIEKLSLSWESLKHGLASGAVGIINFVVNNAPTGRNVNTGFGGLYGLQPWALDPAMTGGLTAIGRSGSDRAAAAGGDLRLNTLHLAQASGQSPSEQANINLQYSRGVAQEAGDAYLKSGTSADLGKVNTAQSNVRANEIALKNARTLESQLQEFQKEQDKELNPSTAASDLRTLRNRFNLLRGRPDFEAHYDRVKQLASGALAYREMERFHNDEEMKSYTPQQAAGLTRTLRNKYPALAGNEEFEGFYSRANAAGLAYIQDRGGVLSREMATKDLAKNEKAETSDETKRSRAFARGMKELGRGDVQYIAKTVNEALQYDEATRGVDYAFTVGVTAAKRHKMTEEAFQRLELGDTLGNVVAAAAPRINAANASHDALMGTYNTLNKEDPRFAMSTEGMKMYTDAVEKLNDAAIVELRAREDSIHAINRFNESIDASGFKMRDEIAGGLTSILIGAQSGGASGARNAARGFAQGQESTILKNLFNVGLQEFTGIGKPGSGPDPNSTIGRITQGTIFGGVGRKIEVDENTAAIKDLTATLRGGGSGVRGSVTGGGGGSFIPTRWGGGGLSGSGDNSDLPYAGVGYDPIYAPSTGTGGSAASIAKSVAGLSSVLTPLAKEVTGGGGGVSAVAHSAIGQLGNILGGAKYAGQIPGILNGSVGLNAGQTVGAFAGAAAAGFGVYEGIHTAFKGGAKNITSGAGAALMSGAVFTGPAAPFVAAAGAALELVSALLPDPKQVRQTDIQNRIFANKYNAPEAINLSRGSNGGYADMDAFGNVRSSQFSAYPIVSDAYLDIPRKTVVPGRTVSGYGGFVNATGAQTPQIIIPITVHTMDAKSFNDNAPQIIDSIHHGLTQSGAPELMNTLSQHLGLRG